MSNVCSHPMLLYANQAQFAIILPAQLRILLPGGATPVSNREMVLDSHIGMYTPKVLLYVKDDRTTVVLNTMTSAHFVYDETRRHEIRRVRLLVMYVYI